MSKSIQIIVALKNNLRPPVSINNIIIPELQLACYLGMHLNKILNWKEHIVKKD